MFKKVRTRISLLSLHVLVYKLDQIASLPLLLLHRHEQSLEVAHSETVMVLSLDELVEERGSVGEGLAEDLQEVAVFVEVDENVVILQQREVFFDVELVLVHLFLQDPVVRSRRWQELHAAFLSHYMLLAKCSPSL